MLTRVLTGVPTGVPAGAHTSSRGRPRDLADSRECPRQFPRAPTRTPAGSLRSMFVYIIVLLGGCPWQCPWAPMGSRGLPGGKLVRSRGIPKWELVGSRGIRHGIPRKPTGTHEIPPGFPRAPAGSHGKYRANSHGNPRGNPREPWYFTCCALLRYTTRKYPVILFSRGHTVHVTNTRAAPAGAHADARETPRAPRECQ